MVRPAIQTEAERDPDFARWVQEVPEAGNIRQCIHCGVCTSSCPMSVYMDRSPREVLHLAREGYKNDVMRGVALWLCSTAYACSVKCPREIRVADVLYALKRRAIEEGMYPKNMPLPTLAREFQKMVWRNGRISEARLVLRVMLRTNRRRLFGMRGIGLKLMRAGRFPLRRERVQRQAELRRFLDAVRPGKEGAA